MVPCPVLLRKAPPGLGGAPEKQEVGQICCHGESVQYLQFLRHLSQNRNRLRWWNVVMDLRPMHGYYIENPNVDGADMVTAGDFALLAMMGFLLGGQRHRTNQSKCRLGKSG